MQGAPCKTSCCVLKPTYSLCFGDFLVNSFLLFHPNLYIYIYDIFTYYRHVWSCMYILICFYISTADMIYTCIYIYAYICICTQMLSLHVIQATPFGESPRLSEWETTIGMLGRRSLEGYHRTCQSEQSLGSNGGQHLYDIFVIFFFKIPQTWDPEKQNPWYVFTYVYIYICFVEGFRMMFSASNLRTTYPKYVILLCFHIDSLCHIQNWLLQGGELQVGMGIGTNGGHVGTVVRGLVGILRIWKYVICFFGGSTLLILLNVGCLCLFVGTILIFNIISSIN